MLQAITQMARQQLVLEAKLGEHGADIADNRTRIEQLEAQLGNPDRMISTAQASRISQAVKAIALELGKRSGSNEFGGVYGELYRRFEIAAYRELPAARYDEAIKFLADWYGTLTGENVPF